MALVAGSTVGSSAPVLAAPALQLGSMAAPATTEAAAAVTMVIRRRFRLNFLDFTEILLCPGRLPGDGIFARPLCCL
ncbi:hypothetical protein SAV31267_010690 [Streptomyces avermitilis]|uniref:Secreted protein n=1 Tax=Streptomyces avermitilis TaxID=33903 RepID=A0A4D4MIQ8_STRAX|nr:hypothetical protein SAV31267_010690 [Streptomyces avermitilis]